MGHKPDPDCYPPCKKENRTKWCGTPTKNDMRLQISQDKRMRDSTCFFSPMGRKVWCCRRRDRRQATVHRTVASACLKSSVGAIIDRPWILLKQNPSPQGENRLIFLRKIRKTLFFGGRSMIAPTSPKENRVSRQSTGLSHYRSFESAHNKRKKPNLSVELFLLAEDEGFEPPRTESESGVLPLH